MIQEIKEDPVTPTKQPKQLMGENETSSKKSSVKFDESRNVVKEFAKNEKIITNFHTPKIDENLKPKKMAKIAVDMSIRKLITLDELVDRIDPDEMIEATGKRRDRFVATADLELANQEGLVLQVDRVR